MRSPGDLSDAELDTTLDLLFERVTKHERLQLLQLQNVFNGLSEVAFDNCALTIKQPEESDRRSDVLKVHIRDYFQRESMDMTLEIMTVHDVSVTIYTYSEYFNPNVNNLVFVFSEKGSAGRAAGKRRADNDVALP